MRKGVQFGGTAYLIILSCFLWGLISDSAAAVRGPSNPWRGVVKFSAQEKGTVPFFYLLTPGLNFETLTFAIAFQAVAVEGALLISFPFVAST